MIPFEAWLKDRNPSHKRLINKLRKLVAKASPKLIESSKWTNGVWLKEDLPIIFIYTKDDHIQFGFFAGGMLNDPDGLLRGNGKFVRHIRVESSQDIEEDKFATMIRRAVRAPSYKS